MRIRLQAEEVKGLLINSAMGEITADTRKPWVANVNVTEGTFKLVRTNPSMLPFRILEGNFFTIFVDGASIREPDITW